MVVAAVVVDAVVQAAKAAAAEKAGARAVAVDAVGAKGNRAIVRADAETAATSSSRTSSPSIALPRL